MAYCLHITNHYMSDFLNNHWLLVFVPFCHLLLHPLLYHPPLHHPPHSPSPCLHLLCHLCTKYGRPTEPRQQTIMCFDLFWRQGTEEERGKEGGRRGRRRKEKDERKEEEGRKWNGRRKEGTRMTRFCHWPLGLQKRKEGWQNWAFILVVFRGPTRASFPVH